MVVNIALFTASFIVLFWAAGLLGVTFPFWPGLIGGGIGLVMVALFQPACRWGVTNLRLISDRGDDIALSQISGIRLGPLSRRITVTSPQGAVLARIDDLPRAARLHRALDATRERFAA
ncbi:MAG: hypothetical protein Q4G14_07765 [Paracoccus sp. (in: a-proteobacteria)]|uniref:hypothetical protein n=1 Tax=Paracoccus sp. TaxID=267 RepID=UPI0026DECE23|nr:hypothetical protein [Paracoccus sp. (in: a-proteobacteria)]MDO5613123.1 hypothetical protein [Paracoccus sp. (in: a-proteobacteria)]